MNEKYKRKYQLGSLVKVRALSYPDQVNLFYGVVVGYANNNDWFGDQLILMSSNGIVNATPGHCKVISRPYIKIKVENIKQQQGN